MQSLKLASVLVLASVLGACATAGGDGPDPIRPTARYALDDCDRALAALARGELARGVFMLEGRTHG